MNNIIFFVICIFLYYLICICLYMIFEESNDNRRIKKSKFIIDKIDKILKIELINIKNNTLNNISYKNLKYIKKYLKSDRYQQIIVKHLLDLKNRTEIIDFFNKTKIIEEIIIDDKKNEFKKAYYAYLIGKFKIQTKYDFLIKNCENKSIYVQINTIRALASLGDYDYYIQGLYKILDSNTLIHKKVIIETLFLFKEINPRLDSKLEELISDNISINLLVVIINYFTSIKYINASEKIYGLLCNENTDKEVLIASIRYFSETDAKDIKEILIKLMKSHSWEIRAISSTSIKRYNDEEVINALKKSITDEVWYVRQNSARSLYFLIDDKESLFNIIDKSDKYACDAILSILSENSKLDEYKNLN